jgi:hypothetical protein
LGFNDLIFITFYPWCFRNNQQFRVLLIITNYCYDSSLCWNCGIFLRYAAVIDVLAGWLRSHVSLMIPSTKSRCSGKIWTFIREDFLRTFWNNLRTIAVYNLLGNRPAADHRRSVASRVNLPNLLLNTIQTTYD